MPWELLSDKRRKEYLKDAKKAAKELEEGCSHEELNSGGYCLVKKEICYYENQKECPDYEPRIKVKK